MTQDVHVCLAQIQPFFPHISNLQLFETGGAESLIWIVGRVYTELAPTHLDEKPLVEDSVFYVSYIYLEGKLCKSQESAW